MTKLTLLIFITSTFVLLLLNVAESGETEDDSKAHDERDAPPDENLEDENAVRRSGIVFVSNGPMFPGTNPRKMQPLPVISGIECYSCTDCPKVFPNTTTKICPPSYDDSKQRSCVVYAENYKHMKRPWYTRGCASERGSCDEIRHAHSIHNDIVKLQFCNQCEGDRCNGSGASRSFSDCMIGFFTLIVTPLVAKYTFS